MQAAAITMSLLMKYCLWAISCSHLIFTAAEIEANIPSWY